MTLDLASAVHHQHHRCRTTFIIRRSIHRFMTTTIMIISIIIVIISTTMMRCDAKASFATNNHDAVDSKVSSSLSSTAEDVVSSSPSSSSSSSSGSTVTVVNDDVDDINVDHINSNDDDDANSYYHVDDFVPVNWSAPFLSGGGYSSEAISFALSLMPFFGRKLSITQHGDSYDGAFDRGLPDPIRRSLHSMLREPPPKHRSVASMVQSLVGGVNKPNIAICHSEPGAWSVPSASYNTPRCPSPLATITIGRTMFETDRLPNGWAARCNHMDAIWVPTEFHRDIFIAGGVEAEKVRVVPEPVDTDFYSNDNARSMEPFDLEGRSTGIKSNATKSTSTSINNDEFDRPYRFLSIFKFEERKGWTILIEAFVREFSVDNMTNVTNSSDSSSSSTSSPTIHTPILYILTSTYHSSSDFSTRISSFISSLSLPSHVLLPSIRLVPRGVPGSMMPALYIASDAFVLPSRGEGWGRPHVEAMAVGLPIIATNWSGPTAYMSDDNSYAVNIDGMDTIVDGPFARHKWARPSIAHLRQRMREVVTHPHQAREKGKRAARDMQSKYCQSCVAKIVIDELARVQGVLKRKRMKQTNEGTTEKMKEKIKDEL